MAMNLPPAPSEDSSRSCVAPLDAMPIATQRFQIVLSDMLTATVLLGANLLLFRRPQFDAMLIFGGLPSVGALLLTARLLKNHRDVNWFRRGALMVFFDALLLFLTPFMGLVVWLIPMVTVIVLVSNVPALISKLFKSPQ